MTDLVAPFIVWNPSRGCTDDLFFGGDGARVAEAVVVVSNLAGRLYGKRYFSLYSLNRT
jgi:hypothetical protein